MGLSNTEDNTVVYYPRRYVLLIEKTRNFALQANNAYAIGELRWWIRLERQPIAYWVQTLSHLLSVGTCEGLCPTSPIHLFYFPFISELTHLLFKMNWAKVIDLRPWTWKAWMDEKQKYNFYVFDFKIQFFRKGKTVYKKSYIFFERIRMNNHNC